MLRRNVLIFHNAALGDFVLTWPVAVALSRVMAQSRVKYVTAGEKGRLAERALRVEYADVENGWHALHAAAGAALAEGPAKLLSGLQLAVVFAQGDAAAFVENLRQRAGEAPVIVLAPKPPGGTHVWDHQLAELAAVPWLASAVGQVQAMARSRGLCATPPGDAARVVIHPGSGAARKNWPIERFIAVAEELKARGRSVTFVIGEVEREQFADTALAGIRATADVVSPNDLVALHDTLTASAAYVGNDSGPTHLAAALGRRVVALFGPTSDAASWAPVGPHVHVAPFDTTPETVIDLLAGPSTFDQG
ncbi:MAG TPA: glycosyltransferase family 9 protein [Tepidisphaeraceae bacterium]|jgi:ADP-heptose:LPS heptosyltransferase